MEAIITEKDIKFSFKISDERRFDGALQNPRIRTGSILYCARNHFKAFGVCKILGYSPHVALAHHSHYHIPFRLGEGAGHEAVPLIDEGSKDLRQLGPHDLIQLAGSLLEVLHQPTQLLLGNAAAWDGIAQPHVPLQRRQLQHCFVEPLGVRPAERLCQSLQCDVHVAVAQQHRHVEAAGLLHGRAELAPHGEAQLLDGLVEAAQHVAQQSACESPGGSQHLAGEGTHRALLPQLPGLAGFGNT
mmetsp:Transcript_8862/g.13221  ORF Transcript_8862/g.13221 Transcript_8862/m.13221 type:complete len:244 (+) Transcript_8862:502-1233(+)